MQHMGSEFDPDIPEDAPTEIQEMDLEPGENYIEEFEALVEMAALSHAKLAGIKVEEDGEVREFDKDDEIVFQLD